MDVRQSGSRSTWSALSLFTAFIVVLLTAFITQVGGLSACQDPPQVIRISRGQKITVVYWVGQNALDEVQPKTEIPLEDLLTEVPPSSITEKAESTDDDSVSQKEENPPVTTEEEVEASTPTKILISTSASTEIHPQVINSEQETTAGVEPNLGAASTSAVPASNTNVVSEADQVITTESVVNVETEQFLDSETELPRTSTVQESQDDNDIASTEQEAASTEAVVTDSINDVPQENVTEGLLDSRSGSDGTEVAYWSTTQDPENEVDSTGILENRNAEEEQLATSTEKIEEFTARAENDTLEVQAENAETTAAPSGDLLNLTARSESNQTVQLDVDSEIAENATSGTGPNAKVLEEPTTQEEIQDGVTSESTEALGSRNSTDDLRVNATDLSGRTANETLNDTEDGKETSVLESISTTIRNIFSTFAPLAKDAPGEDAATEENNEETTQSAPEGRLESQTSDNDVTSSDSDSIVFVDVTKDPLITIDPRRHGGDSTEDSVKEAPTTEGYPQESEPIEGTKLPQEQLIDELTTDGQFPQDVTSSNDEYIPTSGAPDLSTDEELPDLIPESDTISEAARKVENINPFGDNLPSQNDDGSQILHVIPALPDTKNPDKQSPGKLKPFFVRGVSHGNLHPARPSFAVPFPSDFNPQTYSDYIPLGIDPLPSSFLIDDLQEGASNLGPFYPTFYSSVPAFSPPESPVHYVSVVRSPDGILPTRDLRTTKRRRVLQNRMKRSTNNATNCQWIFRSDPGVPLLLTFKSFSTLETPDCRDHYISVERESNGFQSRWCGVSGDRPGHASFARSELNLQLYSTGDGSFPTGFSVEVQALDLKLLRKYAEVRRIIKGQ